MFTLRKYKPLPIAKDELPLGSAAYRIGRCLFGDSYKTRKQRLLKN
jgi:hypothetical protein